MSVEVFFSIENETIAQFLNKNNKYPIKTEDLKKINISTLNEVFKRLDKKLIAILKDVDQSYVEIQKQLSVGNKNFIFDPEMYPTTIKIIQQFCPVGVSEESIFFPLQKYSYDLLPFIQQAYFYSNCDQEMIVKLENEILSSKTVLKYEMKQQQIWFQASSSLIKIYHSCGAYKIHQKTILFGDVIDAWLRYLPSSRYQKEPIYYLVFSNRGEGIGVDCAFEHSFFDFLIQCSIQAFSRNLNIEISSTVKEELSHQFQNEIVRSDLSYFSSFHDLIKQYNWNNWARPSQKLLYLSQYFLKIVDAYQLPIESQSSLFNWMFQLKYLKNRDFKLEGSEEDFCISWEAMKNLGLTKSSYHNNPYIWNLFLFLIEDQRRECWISLLYRFTKYLVPNLISGVFNFFLQNRFVSDEVIHLGNKRITQLLEELEVDDSVLCEEIILEVLSFSFQESRDLTPEEKNSIQMLVTSKSKQYFFSKKNKILFSLSLRKYCLESSFDAVEERINKIDLAVNDAGWNFIGFNLNLFFLYRFHPESLGEIITRLKLLQKIYFDSNRTRFFIYPLLMEKILHNVQQASLSLASSCFSEEDRHPFISMNAELFLTLFFPPLQPLLDMFRISGLSREEGIQWGSAHLVTHLGWYKPILKNHSLGVYLHWDVLDGYPHLFFCFYDQKTKRGQAKTIRLDIPIHELQKQQRVSFFSFFYTFSQMVFKEKADNESIFELSCYKDSSVYWKECFDGLSEAINSYGNEIQNGSLTKEKIEKAWEFAFQVRVAYRNLYLNQILQIEPVFDPQLKPWQIAKEGMIYGNESLIPEYWQRNLRDLSPYRSDASIEFLRSIFQKIFCLNHFPEPLNLNLKLTFNGQDNVFFPVNYWARCASDLLMHRSDTNDGLIDGDFNERNWDARAIPFAELQGTYIVLTIDVEGGTIEVPLYYPEHVIKDFSLFQSYFNFHNLNLKSRAYRELCL